METGSWFKRMVEWRIKPGTLVCKVSRWTIVTRPLQLQLRKTLNLCSVNSFYSNSVCCLRLWCLKKWAGTQQNQQNDKCAPSEDWDQPGHLPSLIRVFAKPFVRRLWSDWVEDHADLSLRWAHRSFCWFYLAPVYIYALNIYSGNLLLL